jgi:hypothetical protein
MTIYKKTMNKNKKIFNIHKIKIKLKKISNNHIKSYKKNKLT